jgi:hypothetical protein
MAGLRHSELWRSGKDPLFILFLVTLALSLTRARDQPSLDLGSVSVVPGDVAIAALALGLLLRVTRGQRPPRAAWPTLLAAAAFSAWLLATAIPNGTDALVTAVKLVELGVLGLAAVVLLTTGERLWLLVAAIVAIDTVAVAWAIVGFIGDPGKRQASFVGEHDLAALSTMVLVIGLAQLYARDARLGRLPLVAGIVGALGVTLGAAVASLLGLYLAVLALVVVGAMRGTRLLRPFALTALVAVAITGGTYGLRSGDLTFLDRWFGIGEEQQAGEGGGSVSQRLIFVYIGGRIFLDSPLAGTGWYGNLPAGEYARYLRAARERFPDQPAHYFPQEDGVYVPQQTYDQILYELGIVGVVLFLALLVAAARAAIATSRVWPAADPDTTPPYIPLAWMASLLGTLAGAALFGGSPIAAIFWLTLGVSAACAALATTAAARR